jgi:polar amino acid transport system substrate-binding protein
MIRSMVATAGAVLLLATSVFAQEPPPLRAAVDGTFAPHAFPNLAGGYQGFNVDLANEIAARLKRKIMIDAAQFSGLVPALQAVPATFSRRPRPSRRNAPTTCCLLRAISTPTFSS